MTAHDIDESGLPGHPLPRQCDEDTSASWAVSRLRVTTDGDPSVLPRLLGLFQNLNIIPRTVVAECGIQSAMHIAIDICGPADARVTWIAQKIGQAPSVLSAYWCRL